MNTIPITPTEDLEAELAQLSTSITDDALKLSDSKARFNSISAELNNRRTAKPDDQPQPTPVTWEQALTTENQRLESLNRTLSLKITEMESEQGRLVVEAMIARDEKRVLEERLVLVSKLIKNQDK